MYFLLHRWREKIRNSTPLHVVTVSELAALLSLLVSVIYLLGFFGIGFVQSFITKHSPDTWDVMDETDHDRFMLEDDSRCKPCGAALEQEMLPIQHTALSAEQAAEDTKEMVKSLVTLTQSSKPEVWTTEDEEIVQSIIAGSTPSYSLESKLGDCRRATAVRREALQRLTGKSLEGLPLDGFDYASIFGQCCEMPVGYVQIPVGIAGPLLLNGKEFMVPMATTEGCLVASTNRGCKAIYVSGGATSVLLRDGMTRAPVVRFASAERAAELKFFLEDPLNFETLALVFNKLVYFSST